MTLAKFRDEIYDWDEWIATDGETLIAVIMHVPLGKKLIDSKKPSNV